MTESEAAKILHDHFYEWWPSEARPGEYVAKIRHHGGGYAAVPCAAMQSSMDHRRAELLPERFRFTWPNLPKGAHYV